jgi:menaquinone-dependent protoporphyrinogen oxidase
MGYRILIAYASRHGATEGIAERLAAVLRADDVEADVREVGSIRDADGYDGYIVGSAIYAGQWLGPATTFVRQHRTLLSRHPVWLFSSGPLSTSISERDAAKPHIADEFLRDLSARGHAVFAGAWRREAPAIGVLEKVMKVIPAARNALPDGDFRPWDEIDRFGQNIAGEIKLALATA